MQKRPRASFDWQQPLWFAALVAASVGFSLGFACAVPLAAFAALGALMLERRTALLLIVAVVCANQLVGFTILHYPRDASTFAWGGAFFLVGLLATLAAGWVKDHAASWRPSALYIAAFLTAFAVYEGGFFLISLISRAGLEPYALPVVLGIFEVNVLAFVGLLVANWVAGTAGLSPSFVAERAVQRGR